MAYPSIPLSPDSRRIIRDGREEDEVGDGVMRVRKLYADKYDFDLKHPALNATDLATLKAFYASNPTATFTFTWPDDGQNYTVRFGKNALRIERLSPLYHDAFVRLVAGA